VLENAHRCSARGGSPHSLAADGRQSPAVSPGLLQQLCQYAHNHYIPRRLRIPVTSVRCAPICRSVRSCSVCGIGCDWQTRNKSLPRSAMPRIIRSRLGEKSACADEPSLCARGSQRGVRSSERRRRAGRVCRERGGGRDPVRRRAPEFARTAWPRVNVTIDSTSRPLRSRCRTDATDRVFVAAAGREGAGV
jgi:hypothetical protein